MKIQLTKSQVQFFADRVREAGVPDVDMNRAYNYRATWNKAVGVLAEHGWSPVTRKDVRAVCIELGWPPGKIDGIASQKFWDCETPTFHATSPDTSPWKNPDGTSKRGYYNLHGAVLPLSSKVPGKHPLQNLPSKATSLFVPKPAPAPSPAEVEVVDLGKAAVDPTLFERVADPTSVYADSLVRQATLEKLKCFGWYSSQEDGCQSCPMAEWCARRAQSRLAQIASQLDLEWDEQVRNASARTRDPAPTSSGTDSKTEADPAAAIQEQDEYKPGDNALGGRILKMPARVLCSACRLPVEAGEKAVLIAGTGSLHIACAKKEA
jgi:hypothetical protein